MIGAAVLTAIATICWMGALVWVVGEVADRGNSAGTENSPTGDIADSHGLVRTPGHGEGL